LARSGCFLRCDVDPLVSRNAYMVRNPVYLHWADDLIQEVVDNSKGILNFSGFGVRDGFHARLVVAENIYRADTVAIKDHP